ncbi:MAG: phosphatidylserine decarboxylase family protein [Syntrophobacterales bacterium]|nr:phosphatidylserine decarboxylase family protein [Syntrophobacterales bacterium]
MSKEDQHSSYIIGEGLPFVFASFLAAILIYWAGFRFASLFFFCLALFITWFFRNPERKTPEKEGLIISPADGLVIKIEEAQSEESPGQIMRKVSIFMNVFNVHVNRFPCSGEIRTISYRPGKFLSANLDKASEVNERNTVVIRMADGREIVTIQIAGLIARRIVWWIKEHDIAQKGKRFGMIRFGSRLEVFMPLSSAVLVKIGDKVRAGETPIGELT